MVMVRVVMVIESMLVDASIDNDSIVEERMLL